MENYKRAGASKYYRSLSLNEKKCYPFKVARDNWGNLYCKCPRTKKGNKSEIQVDVRRVFPGPWFWGGPNWRSNVLETLQERIIGCEKSMAAADLKFGEKLVAVFDPKSPVYGFGDVKPVVNVAAGVLGTAVAAAPITAPVLGPVEAAVAATAGVIDASTALAGTQNKQYITDENQRILMNYANQVYSRL